MRNGHTIKHKPKQMDWTLTEGMCVGMVGWEEMEQGCGLEKKVAGEGHAYT